MKYALISPEEIAFSYNKETIGVRVADVSATKFDVAPPLFWVECSDNVDPDKFYWDGSAVQEKPSPPAQSVPSSPAGGPGVVA